VEFTGNYFTRQSDYMRLSDIT